MDTEPMDAGKGSTPRPGEALRHWPRLPLTYILAASLVLALAWGIARVISAQINLIFLTFLAVLIAAILNYPVTFLGRWIPRSLAALLTLLLIVGGLVLLCYLTIPTLTEQGRHTLEQVPQVVDRLGTWWQRHFRDSGLDQIAQGEEIAQKLSDQLMKQLDTLLSRVLPMMTGVLSAVSAVLLLLVLATFLAYEPRSYVNGIVRFVPQRYVGPCCELMNRLGYTIQNWMLGTFIAMTLVGTLTAAGLALIGIESWLLLGILMFFGEFIPYAGPIIVAVPGIALGLASSPTKALYVLLLYVAIQQLEGYLVSPLVMKRVVSLHPALLLMWQIIMYSAFGFFGLLIATPLLACLKVTLEYLYIERMLNKAPVEEVPGSQRGSSASD